MNRGAFLTDVLGLSLLPALATRKETTMDPATLLGALEAKRPRATSLTVRHVGAYVSTLTTITPGRLARLKPLHETRSDADISAAFEAIEAAEPAPSNESSEPRWHLSFADESGTPILVVTTAVFAPRHGAIDGRRVIYRTDRLVHWLTERYAPEEASARRPG
jgi:hypothetical protein